MTVERYRLDTALVAVCLFVGLHCVDLGQVLAQNGRQGATSTDVAAGNMVDALFDKNVPPGRNTSPRRSVAVQRQARQSNLRAKLVRNSDTSDGSSPYALVDRYGGILRYVEPIDRIDLEAHVGRVVGVRYDTGDTLLASQLILPPFPASAGNGVQQAAFQEPIPAGESSGETLMEPTPAGEPTPALEPIPDSYSFEGEGPMYMEGEPIDFGGSCPQCGEYGCTLHGGVLGGAMMQPWKPDRVWLRAEYLAWWMTGMDTPPLVTESDPNSALLVDRRFAIIPNIGPDGPLDHPDTEIIYGHEPILEDVRSGFRIALGAWIDDERKQGWEVDYLYLGTSEEVFSAGGENNSRVISRPYFELVPFNIVDDEMVFLPPREAAEAVSNDLLDGTVTVTSRSTFQGAGFALRHNLCRCGYADPCCGDFVGCGDIMDCGSGPIGCGSFCGASNDRRYVDFLVGVRWYQLDERLQIFEDLEVDTEGSTDIPDDVLAQDGAQIMVLDRFDTSNDFIGGEFGFDWGIQRNRWSVNLLSKLALGNTRQKVSIFGETNAIDAIGEPSDPQVGGLLALESNIGDYERDRFSVIPAMNLNVGYQLTRNFRAIVGYNLIYWTNVVRPGDQIDRELNGTLIPSFGEDTDPVIPPYRPQFVFDETNVLIQGINVGGEFTW